MPALPGSNENAVSDSVIHCRKENMLQSLGQMFSAQGVLDPGFTTLKLYVGGGLPHKIRILWNFETFLETSFFNKTFFRTFSQKSFYQKIIKKRFSTF